MKFISKYASLILQDDDGVYAAFSGGEFETTDKVVVERLKKNEDVEVAKAAPKAAE